MEMNTQDGETSNPLSETSMMLSQSQETHGTELSHVISSQRKLSKWRRRNQLASTRSTSFEHFLEERFEWGGKDYLWHRAIRGWYPSADHVCDADGNLKCDMMRFEHLNDDLCAYFDVKEMSRARNVTALNKGTYQDIYTDKTIQIVADWYKADIDLFGYDFDTGAQKNYWRK